MPDLVLSVTTTAHEPHVEQPLPDSYAFVLNVRSLPDVNGHAIFPGHTLRRATPQETGTIKEPLATLLGPLADLGTTLWEQAIPGVGDKTLPESAARYFVIAFDASTTINTVGSTQQMQRVFDLASAEIECGLTVSFRRVGGRVQQTAGMASDRPYHVLQGTLGRELIDVTTRHLDDIKQLYDKFQALDPSADIHRLVTQLVS